MKTITINNYEEFALDYIEGNLDKELRFEFELFLNDHFEIKEELERFLNLKISSNAVIYPEKESLIKPVENKNNSRSYIILACVIALIGSAVVLMQNNKLNTLDDKISRLENNTTTTSQRDSKNESNAPMSDKAIDKNDLKEVDKSEAVNGLEPNIKKDKGTIKDDETKSKDNAAKVKKAQNVSKKINKESAPVPVKKEPQKTDSIEKEETIIYAIEETTEKSDTEIQLGKNNKNAMAHIPSSEHLNTKGNIKKDIQSIATLPLAAAKIEGKERNEVEVYDRLEYVKHNTIKTKKGVFGEFALSNVTISLLPSYLQTKK